MKKKHYEQRLRACAKDAVIPDVLDEIKRADLSAYRTSDDVPQAARRPQKKSFFAGVAAVAGLILIFVFAVLPQLTNSSFDATVYATASMSVNNAASFSIELNQSSQVVDITTDSQAGDAVLESLSYRKKNFDGVLTELMKACIDYWDLTEEQLENSVITFSADCHDSDNRANLEKHFDNSMGAAKQHCKDKESAHNGHH